MFGPLERDAVLPIPVSEFGSHVRQMHAEKTFKTEYEVAIENYSEIDLVMT